MTEAFNNPVLDDKALRDRALFDRIAESYARKDLFPASAVARQTRLQQTLSHHALGTDIDILEIGCGAGYSARYLSGSYRSFTGIDYSEELIRYAKAENSVPNARFEAIDLENYHPGCQFDAVFMIGVLHHMTDMAAEIRSVVKLLRPGGMVAVNEPQPSNPIVHGMRMLRVKLDKSYSGEQVELTVDQVKTLFSDAGLVNVSSAPQGYLSTPFAEVVIKPGIISRPLSSAAVYIDAKLEKYCKILLRNWSWNAVVSGTKPDHPTGN
jgi:2-polyprenyl-3-methyl-5-hydroxy-6-metoxy-1,4-benzoquinol methylase